MMHCNNSNRRRVLGARGCAVLFAVLAMGLGAMTSPAAAAPFAYVANTGTDTVSVIDTANNTVVATVAVGSNPIGVAVTPDGKHVYVTNETFTSNSVSVIDTASNMVAVTVPVGSNAFGVAVTPDGNHVYVTRLVPNTVSVIDTAINTVLATVQVGNVPAGVAVAPDGKRAYVANSNTNNVSVIDTASYTVVATVPVGDSPDGVAVTPDGKHVYVTNFTPNSVSVIDTATNTVVATIRLAGNFGPTGVAVAPDGKHAYVIEKVITLANSNVSVIATATNTVVATVTVGLNPQGGVAFTPDGKHAYVTNAGSIDVNGTVSVIDTATNTVVATITVGTGPVGVGIVPPPPGVPFLAFSAQVEIALHRAPNTDVFVLDSHFILRSTAPGNHPATEPVKLQVGTFSITIPPGSFKKRVDGSFTFAGVIHGVRLKARIKPTGTLRYAIHAEARGANLQGTRNTVYVTLIIGGDSGATSVTAQIFR